MFLQSASKRMAKLFKCFGSAASASTSPIPRDFLMSLFPAVEDGDAEKVGFILNRYPAAAISTYNDQGEHLLHIAAKGGHSQVIQLLTTTHAIAVDILSTKAHQNILHYAAYWGHDGLLSSILVTVQEQKLQSMLLTKNNHGHTPLHLAALGCQQYSFDLLLAAGANPEEKALDNKTAPELLSLSSQPYCFVEEEQSQQPAADGGPSAFDGLRLQVASDLHVEFFDDDDPDEYLLSVLTPSAPNLALLGDIGVVGHPRYERFLDLMLKKFERVFLVLGNHEFYNAVQDRSQWTTMEQRIERMERFCAHESRRDRLILMNKRAVVVDGVKIIGCTLWTHIPEHRLEDVGRGMYDFRRITIADESQPTRARVFSTVDALKVHLEEVEWIKQELREAGSQPCIVLSHHAPTTRLSSAPEFDTSSIRSGFSSDLEELFRCHGPSHYPLVGWGFGHTHYNCNQMTAGTRVFSNQRGYEHRRYLRDDSDVQTINLECGDSYTKIFVLRVPATPLPSL